MKRRETIKLLGLLPIVPLTTFKNALGSEKYTYGPIVESGYDLVIYGATPGGIACAIRAAREGVKVLIVNHNQHLGGMFVNGLGTMDTLYNGARSPIYDEFRYNIYDFYRSKYGYHSTQYQETNPGLSKTRFESHVAEQIIGEMLNRESGITVLKGYYPESVEKSGRQIRKITFRKKNTEETLVIESNIFADCSYEGDLVAVSGINYRLGRESSKEFGEEHAGVAYMQKDHWPAQGIMDKRNLEYAGTLNLFRYKSWSDLIRRASTGNAHPAIQAFNLRTTLTNDPNNRILPNKPKDYNPKYIRETFEYNMDAGLEVPNLKTSWNEPELIGEQNKYIEGNWEERQRITDKFRDITMSVLYFNQNDPSLTNEVRNYWRQFGLSKDEYQDNGNLPYEIYVREGRRIIGQSVFTEHDAKLANGLNRAPVHANSISVTEWFMDSHACTDSEMEGSKKEGEVMLKNKTFPGQIPLNTLFPESLDNLIVPVCLSASHIGWGTIRLEPTWMSIGEAAGYAVSMAVKSKMPLSQINSNSLVRLLAKKHIMLSFFNDMEGREYASWYPAIQYLGTQGFFGSYEAQPNKLLTSSIAKVWITNLKKWLNNQSNDPNSDARDVYKAEQQGGGPLSTQSFAKQLSETINRKGYSPEEILLIMARLNIPSDAMITRGDACRIIFEVTSIED
tara:strand:+ start:1368 stop:3398 length:2031 start_codon:yes stop_codon:yes gene_type:complete